MKPFFFSAPRKAEAVSPAMQEKQQGITEKFMLTLRE
jgi:hypothetical protein